MTFEIFELFGKLWEMGSQYGHFAVTIAPKRQLAGQVCKWLFCTLFSKEQITFISLLRKKARNNEKLHFCKSVFAIFTK